jgi:hypothetical protein
MADMWVIVRLLDLEAQRLDHTHMSDIMWAEELR